MVWTRQFALPVSVSRLILTRNASRRVGALRPARHAIIVSSVAGLQRISRQKSQWHPRRNHNGFAPPLARPPMPPAAFPIRWFNFPRHSGASRNLRPAISPSFRRKPESTPCDFPIIPACAGIYALRFPVIPAQAGIYAPRRTPVFAGITAPQLNRPIENAASRPPRQNPAKFTPIMPPPPLTNASSRPILAIVRCGEEKRSGFARAKRKVTATS